MSASQPPSNPLDEIKSHLTESPPHAELQAGLADKSSLLQDNKPRYAFGWFDKWLLVIPILLVLALCGLVWVSCNPATIIPPAPTAPAAVTTIALNAPSGGTTAAVGQPIVLNGQAPPGSEVQLLNQGKVIATTTADANGNYEFKLTPSQPGVYELQTVTAINGQQVTSSPVTITIAESNPNATSAASGANATAVPNAPTDTSATGGASATNVPNAPTDTSATGGANATVVPNAPTDTSATGGTNATVVPNAPTDTSATGGTSATVVPNAPTDTSATGGASATNVPNAPTDTSATGGANATAVPNAPTDTSATGGTSATVVPNAPTDTSAVGGTSATNVPNATAAAQIISLEIGAVPGSVTVGQPLHLFGIAPPGATVQLYNHDAFVAETVADANGNYQFDVRPTAAGEYVLRTVTTVDGQQVSSASLTIVVAQAGTGATSTANATPGASETAVSAANATGTPIAESTPDASGGGNGNVNPPTLNLGAAGIVALGAALTGTAPPNSHVVIYLDDKAVGSADADASGVWQFTLSESIAPGSYTIAIVVTDANGKPIGAPSEKQTIHIAPKPLLPVTGGAFQ